MLSNFMERPKISLQELQSEKSMLESRIPRWQNISQKIGIEGTITFGSSLENSARAGRARKSIAQRIDRNQERLKEVTTTLDAVGQATTYLSDLEVKRGLLTDIQSLAQEGYVPVEVLQQHEEEFSVFESQPLHNPLIQQGIDILQTYDVEDTAPMAEPSTIQGESGTVEEITDQSDDQSKNSERQQIQRGLRAVHIGRLAFGIESDMPSSWEDIIIQAYPEDNIAEIADEHKRRVRVNYRRVAITNAIQSLENWLENSRYTPKSVLPFVEELKATKLFIEATPEERRMLANRAEGWEEIVAKILAPGEIISVGQVERRNDERKPRDLNNTEVRLMIKALEHNGQRYTHADRDDVIRAVWERRFQQAGNRSSEMLEHYRNEFAHMVPEITAVYAEGIKLRGQGKEVPKNVHARFRFTSDDSIMGFLTIEELQQVMTREISFEDVLKIATQRGFKQVVDGVPDVENNGAKPDVDNTKDIKVPETQTSESNGEKLRPIEERDPGIRDAIVEYLDLVAELPELQGEEFNSATISKALHIKRHGMDRLIKSRVIKPVRMEGSLYYLDLESIVASLYLLRQGRNLPANLKKDVPDLVDEIVLLREQEEERRRIAERRGKRRVSSEDANKYFDDLLVEER